MREKYENIQKMMGCQDCASGSIDAIYNSQIGSEIHFREHKRSCYRDEDTPPSTIAHQPALQRANLILSLTVYSRVLMHWVTGQTGKLWLFCSFCNGP